MDLAEKIESAFAHRNKPKVLSVSTSLSPDEADEINRFTDKLWSELTFDDFKKNYDPLFHFSGEAYCYFLPGFMLAGVRADDRSMLAYDVIVGSLDRSPVTAYWDALFLSRWPLLTMKELVAVQEWVLWLAEEPDDPWGNTYDRCFDTLELLKKQKNLAT